MISELLHKIQQSTNFNGPARSYRLHKVDRHWFFQTREGLDIGPFFSKGDANFTLTHFSELREWPKKEDLQAIIEGCELNAAVIH